MPLLLIDGLWTRSDLTLSECQDRVLGDLGLRNNVQVTSGDIGNWLNEGCRILARDSQAFHASFFIPIVSGTTEYAIPFDSGARAITVEEVLYKNRALWSLSISHLYSVTPYWRTSPQATPWAYYQRGMSIIGLYPGPATSGATDLVVTCTVIPPLVTEPQDFLYVPAGCEDAPITYACYRASLKDAYGEGRDRLPIYREEWKLAKARAVQLVSESRSHEIVRMGENALLAEGPWPGYWIYPGEIASPL